MEQASTACQAMVVDFRHIRRAEVAQFGGKNSSLGEMVGLLGSQGIRVPPGFATSSLMFREFMKNNDIDDYVSNALKLLKQGDMTLQKAGKKIRNAFLGGLWPDDLAKPIGDAYKTLCDELGEKDVAVAVRSSATAEDLPDASFAGQQETYLNIQGQEALLEACKKCFASLYTDRAISYREAKGFDHFKVSLSVGVQLMVRSDKGGSGVMFSIDTETGFDKVVVINGAWGLGESVVQGIVDPDEYRVFKPFLEKQTLQPVIGKQLGAKALKMIYASGAQTIKSVPTSKLEQHSFVLDDADVLELARSAVIIEKHYKCPMDIEWAKDGISKDLYIVQARPETVQSRRDNSILKSYAVNNEGALLLSGVSVGSAAVSGRVCMIDDPSNIEEFVHGSILVTKNTDPDWVPIMKKAAAIVTDHGGRTSHAAIVSRELGLPAIVGAGDATFRLHDQQEVTISCAGGDVGQVYDGFAEIAVTELSISDIPDTQTKVMLNMANPGAALRWWQLPADGVGLLRMEFVISNHVKVHPMALVNPKKIHSKSVHDEIEKLTYGFQDSAEFFVQTLARGLSQIASVAYPDPVIVRMSDFKSNEYANLLGGTAFEPVEENPMIGFRGASRYYSEAYRAGFALECLAIKRLRETLGFDNVIVMIPFCRSISEADKVIKEMAANGLVRGENGLKLFVMCEIPSNVVLASRFAKYFDGFSIGSNDLTQLTMGVDRDSDVLGELFDERDDAVKWMIEHLIKEAKRCGTKTGICGQAPSDHPEFARFLVEAGIDSISVTPDSFLSVKQHVAAAEKVQ